MGRKERRKEKRAEKKSNDKKVEAVRWVNSLSPEKAELVKSYARIIANRDNEHFIGALERCYSAAIISELDLELEEVKSIIDTFAVLMEEDARKMKELKSECGGDLEMATKKVNGQAEIVEERARELLKEGLKQKNIVETLASEFPSLSKAMLTNAYKKTKAMMKEAIDMKNSIDKAIEVKSVIEKLGAPDIDTNEAIEYIFGEDKKENSKEEKETDFEIIKEVRILDLKGKYAKYHVENKVVTVDDELGFSNIAEVEEWGMSEVKAINNEIAALEEKKKMIQAKENEISKVIEKFM